MVDKYCYWDTPENGKHFVEYKQQDPLGSKMTIAHQNFENYYRSDPLDPNNLYEISTDIGRQTRNMRQEWIERIINEIAHGQPETGLTNLHREYKGTLTVYQKHAEMRELPPGNVYVAAQGEVLLNAHWTRNLHRLLI